MGEATNGIDGLKLIQEQRPDVVFLDVQMPGMTGLELLTHLEEVPLIVFSTAYDQYALRAFEVHAVDYLLKPYTRQRFATAVTRIRSRLDQPQKGIGNLAQQLREEATTYPDRIMVPRGNRYLALPVADIQLIRAAGDYCTVITDREQYVSSYHLGAIAGRLHPEKFLRIHRSSIVNVEAIREAYREGHGYDLLLKNGEVVRVSRGYAEAVKELLF